VTIEEARLKALHAKLADEKDTSAETGAKAAMDAVAFVGALTEVSQLPGAEKIRERLSQRKMTIETVSRLEGGQGQPPLSPVSRSPTSNRKARASARTPAHGRSPRGSGRRAPKSPGRSPRRSPKRSPGAGSAPSGSPPPPRKSPKSTKTPKSPKSPKRSMRG
jgi:hypothetical protein